MRFFTIFSLFSLFSLQLSLHAQNMGIKLASGTLPNTTLDVNGSAAFREGTALGLTLPVNDNVALGAYSFFRITGATSPFSITGFGNGTDGRVLTIVNASGQLLTLPHQTTSTSSSVNQINTGGANLTLDNNGVVTLVYNATLSKWVVTGGQGFTNDWSLLGNRNTIDGSHFLGTVDNIPLSFRVNNRRSGYISQDNTFLGYEAGLSNTSNTATFIGTGAGRSNTSGNYNTGIGRNALYLNTTGDFNTAIGYSALGTNNTGSYNFAFGVATLTNNKTGNNNVGLGTYSLTSNTTGNNNMALGTNSLSANTTASNNTGIGYGSLYNNTIGESNTAIGSYSASRNTTGGENTATGFGSLVGNAAGSRNAAFGFYAGYGTPGNDFSDNSYFGNYAGALTTTGSYNVAVGSQALRSVTASSNSVAIGFQSGVYTSSNNHVFIGYRSGITNTTGTNNTLLGYNADVTSATLTNATAIGANAAVGASNSLVLGGTGANAVNVGIGTTSPVAKLEINTGTANNGIILKSPTASVGGAFVTIDPNANVAANTPVNTLWFDQRENADIAMATNSTTRFWIKANGNVGIGVNNPSHILHISNQGRSTNAAWATTSDIRLKNIDKPFEYGLKELLKVQTYHFHYKKDNPLNLPSEKPFQGVIAQEMQKLIPEAVVKTPDGYLTVNNDPIFWSSINAIKELDAVNQKLKSESETLKSELEQVKAELKRQQILTDKVLKNTDELKSENIILKQNIEKNNKDIEMIKAMLEKKQ